MNNSQNRSTKLCLFGKRTRVTFYELDSLHRLRVWDPLDSVLTEYKDYITSCKQTKIHACTLSHTCENTVTDSTIRFQLFCGRQVTLCKLKLCESSTQTLTCNQPFVTWTVSQYCLYCLSIHCLPSNLTHIYSSDHVTFNTMKHSNVRHNSDIPRTLGSD